MIAKFIEFKVHLVNYQLRKKKKTEKIKKISILHKKIKSREIIVNIKKYKVNKNILKCTICSML